MPTPQSSTDGITKSGRASARPDDAVSLLMSDHRTVEDLFKEYEKAKSDPKRKQKIMAQIDTELRVHMELEEKIFYPASREHLDEDDIVNEAEVEHAGARNLMDQLQGMDPADPYFDAKVTVLKEMIEHHVEEEETDYFPDCRRSDMDLKAVGEELKTRKAELTDGTSK
jgi:hemerythrin superfamily protein